MEPTDAPRRTAPAPHGARARGRGRPSGTGSRPHRHPPPPSGLSASTLTTGTVAARDINRRATPAPIGAEGGTSAGRTATEMGRRQDSPRIAGRNNHPPRLKGAPRGGTRGTRLGGYKGKWRNPPVAGIPAPYDPTMGEGLPRRESAPEEGRLAGENGAPLKKAHGSNAGRKRPYRGRMRAVGSV